MIFLFLCAVLTCSASVLPAHASQSAGPVRASTLDGVRTSYRNQLWRMSGRLITTDGSAYSYVATFFRYAEPHGVVLYPASFSVLDESSGHLFSARRTERAGFGTAEATTRELAIQVGTWSLRQSSGTRSRPTFDFDGDLDGLRLRVHGIARKSRFALHSATGEYDEYSSIRSIGTIARDGRHFDVTGSSWLDHELSNIDPSGTAPVAQFRVQLNDGREVFIETSASPDKRVAPQRAFFIERDGTVDTLRRSSYAFGRQPGPGWRSPQTRTIYPNLWTLHVAGKTEFLSLEPVRYDQESPAHGDGLSYWDGAVDVYDVTPGSLGLRLGSGYVLMYGHSAEPKTE
jgi:predicted secreted hydrolase